MVIGKGLLARRFDSYNDDDRFLIFASGVSNSKTKNQEAYTRELTLLKECIGQNKDKIIVYFSTCSVYDPDEKESPYVLHKLNIEDIIQNSPIQHFIFRISNVAGNSPNPNTLLNYFVYHIKNGINFDLWTSACRNIIGIDDVFFIVDTILKNYSPSQKPINVACPFNYPAKEILTTIENFLGIGSNYIEVDKGSCFEIDVSDISSIIKKLDTKFDKKYLATLLSRYFTV